MSLIEKIIKPEIRNLLRIRDTFDERFEYLRLDKKERLIEFDAQLLREFKESITYNDLSGYYELGATYNKLADYLEVGRDQLLLAAGSDLAIKSVYEACISRGDKVVLHSPGYAMFRVYASMFGADLDIVPVKEDWTLNVEEMLLRVDSRTKMVVVENPNGFVGTKPDDEVIEYCAKTLFEKDVLFLVDEAYIYLEEVRSKTPRLIERYSNLLVTQTFSKGHGLAGLRIGYLIGDKDVMSYISRVRPMHEISSLSARATEWILDHPSLLLDYQRKITESKKFLVEELTRMNISVKNTHASFVLLYLPDEGKTRDLAKKMKQRKILIRRPFEEPCLRGWSLVCVGTKEDSMKFLRVLTEVLSEDISRHSALS